MRSHGRWCIFFACGIAVSVPLGLYVNSRSFIVTAVCIAWCVYHLVKLVSGERYEKKETFKGTFEQFYGGPKDDTT